MELDMTKGKPSGLIIRFIIPLVIGNIFQQLYNMVDTIIVGQFVGVKALAAVGATGTIMFLILGFMQGLTTGFTVLTSQRFGAGDMEGMKKSVGTAAILSILSTVVMTAVSVAGMNGLLHLMQTPEDIFDMSRTYIIIICAGMGCTVLYNLMASILRAVGNSKVPLYFLIVSAVTNIILDLVFIINFHMGVAGAAWATVISQGLSGLLCVLYVARKVAVLRLEKRHFALDFHLMKVETSIGFPMAIQFSITAVGTIMVQAALNMLGSMAVAAYTAASKVEQLVTQPFLAMGMTMATYAGQNRGVNAYDRIRQGARFGLLISTIYALTVFALIMIFKHALIAMFVSENLAEIEEYATIYLFLCGTCFTPLGMIFIYRNILQGCGYALIPTMGGVVELVSRAVVAVIAASRHSFTGVCVANMGAWVSAGIFLFISYQIIFYRIAKKERSLQSPKAESAQT